MPVFRVDKQSNYTKVWNYFIRDPDLSLRGKGMLTLLLSLPEDWQYSIAGLSSITKEGEDAVRSALKELEWRGYLERQRRRDELGMLREMEFTIYEQPKGTFDLRTGIPYLENPMTENPSTEVPVREFPSTGGSGTINN